MFLFYYIASLVGFLGLIFVAGYLIGANFVKNDIYLSMRRCDHDYDDDDTGIGVCRRCGHIREL